MIVDSDNEVLNGVVYTLSKRFEGHFDLGLGGVQNKKENMVGKDSEVHHRHRIFNMWCENMKICTKF